MATFSAVCLSALRALIPPGAASENNSVSSSNHVQQTQSAVAPSCPASLSLECSRDAPRWKDAAEEHDNKPVRNLFFLYVFLLVYYPFQDKNRMSPLEALEHFMRGRWTGVGCLHASKHQEPLAGN
jgi:hypothetical protein